MTSHWQIYVAMQRAAVEPDYQASLLLAVFLIIGVGIAALILDTAVNGADE